MKKCPHKNQQCKSTTISYNNQKNHIDFTLINTICLNFRSKPLFYTKWYKVSQKLFERKISTLQRKIKGVYPSWWKEKNKKRKKLEKKLEKTILFFQKNFLMG